MIISLDRVQYSQKNNMYYIFEFLTINNIKDYILLGLNGGFEGLIPLLNDYDKVKIDYLRNKMPPGLTIYIIIYEQSVESNYVVLTKKPFNNWQYYVVNFKLLQEWFRTLNNIDSNGLSKKLASARDSNIDTYINDILINLYDLNTLYDDNGIELTKKLLAGDETKAIDADLFQYVESTNEYIIYEFLKNDTGYLHNIQAHPMRYSWKNEGYIGDNKLKYISFWNLKKFFGGKLFLINYSENDDERISIIDVVDLDPKTGFTAEKKYCMSKNVFLAWLKDMHEYNKSHNEYLADFKCVEYTKQFFDNWNTNARKYGEEFKINGDW